MEEGEKEVRIREREIQGDREESKREMGRYRVKQEGERERK